MSGFVVVLADGRRIEIPREIEAAGAEAVERYVTEWTEKRGRQAARRVKDERDQDPE